MGSKQLGSKPGEGSEATEPYNKYDKFRRHSIRPLQFNQKVRPLSFRPEKFDLFTATHENGLSESPTIPMENDASGYQVLNCGTHYHVILY